MLAWPLLVPGPASAQGEPKADESADPEERVGIYLQSLAEEEREKWTQKMMALVEDIDRVCLLSDPQRDRLDLAAKGAVDLGLNRWRTNLETWVRDKARNVQGDIEQFLAGVGSVRFGDSAKAWEPENQEIWRTTLATVLDEAQRKAYQEDVRQRFAFKHGAMAGALVADLDRTLRLSDDQRARLLVLATQAAATFWERLETWAGDEENLPYHQLGALLGAVPEAERDEILGEAQRQAWDEYFLRFDAAWQAIKDLPREEIP